MSDDFRHALRSRTHAAHENVDRLLSTVDISSIDGFRLFLTIHHVCFVALLQIAKTGSNARAGLDDMIGRIESDLRFLGSSTPTGRSIVISQSDTLALDYVIEGSRLGSKVLKRQWSASNDLRVQRANNYFSTNSSPDRWREVCNLLSSIPVNSDRADKIVLDTQKLFGVFQTVACEMCADHKLDKAPV